MAKRDYLHEYGGMIGCLIVLTFQVLFLLVIIWIVLDLLHKATG